MICKRNSIGMLTWPALIMLCISCGCRKNSTEIQDRISMAGMIENYLFRYTTDVWYPTCIDSLYGGYLPDFEYDWSVSPGSQEKALVQQARHLWTLSFLSVRYPENSEFPEYARQGYEFIREHFVDREYGGMFYACSREGLPSAESLDFKRIYGQAFAINGLSAYFKASGDSSSLELAKSIFYWMDEFARDPISGGYFECLQRNGLPEGIKERTDQNPGDSPLTGLKEFNSSLHILEAFTYLYQVWPDSLLYNRLEEMYLLFRDRIIHPEGYLLLYFYPDWTLVPEDTMNLLSGGNYWFTQHVTYGHDVETAYLLLEAAQVLGRENDKKTGMLAKKLVDHSLETGWDSEKGGFYYVGYIRDGKTEIYVDHKAWWTEAEGLNALLLMDTLYPDDPLDYYRHFTQLWSYIDEYLIDKEYGGWYNYGIDNYPENKTQKKSHNWKATYHNVRAMVNCIEMLEECSFGVK